MKKYVILVAVILLAGVAVLTRPSKDQHIEAIMLVVNEAVNDNLSEDDGTLSGFMMLFGNGVIKYTLDNILIIQDHYLWNVGYLSFPGNGTKKVSVGVFGHVFTFSKDQLSKAIGDM